MSIFFAFVLHIFHLVYAIILKVRSLRKQLFASPPQQLLAPRRRIPKHLAIVFAVDSSVPLETAVETLTESVLNAVEWCRTIGIKKLTVYEEKDMLSKCTRTLYVNLPVQGQELDSGESEIDYPLTPPPSDHSESRPLSPNDAPENHVPVTRLHISERSPRKEMQNGEKAIKKRRQQKPTESAHKSDLLLCMISAEASKPAIAAAARALARTESRRLRNSSPSEKREPYKLTVEELDRILEDASGLSSPDFMIIHSIDFSRSSSAPPELHGFPPWHIRLTEIFQNYPRDRSQPWFSWRRPCTSLPLDEISFREALDEFASAEMRFGK
ncbi:hypothetical protein BDZ97DRAFT_1264615 [Flammula alnicola]|nr:hypothetical protein BDZ97DRAFT_1264615 [Flammula alnicola]